MNSSVRLAILNNPLVADWLLELRLRKKDPLAYLKIKPIATVRNDFRVRNKKGLFHQIYRISTQNVIMVYTNLFGFGHQ